MHKQECFSHLHLYSPPQILHTDMNQLQWLLLFPEYSYISGLIRFGLIGTIIMLFFIVMLAQRMKSTNLDNNTVFFLTASSGFTWGFLFVCIGGDYLFSTQVMLLLVTSLSIMQSSLRDSNSKTKK